MTATRSELTGALRTAQARARNAERARVLALACGNLRGADVHLAEIREELAAAEAIRAALAARNDTE